MSLRKPEELLSPDAVPASLRAGHGIFALAGQFDISPLRLQRLERRYRRPDEVEVERMLIEKNTELSESKREFARSAETRRKRTSEGFSRNCTVELEIVRQTN